MWPVEAAQMLVQNAEHTQTIQAFALAKHPRARVTSPRHISATLRLAKPGEISLACWQHFECVASSISRVQGVYHLKDVVARAPDMLQGVAL